ncbi:MAG: GIY-YIG nuclease family protein [Bacteroidetes bacterium]|nr:GIY-YIG nuclease family protein [Bacteroidota bacterium]
MFYVYILFSVRSAKTYVDRRLIEHNLTEAKGFTLRYRPWTLIRTETFDTKSEAMMREKYLKTGRGREDVKKYVATFLDAGGAVSAAAEKD